MADSMCEINKAIRDLRRELKDVNGDASVEKQNTCMEIIDRISFYTSAKLLFDEKPEYSTNDITLNQLTRST